MRLCTEKERDCMTKATREIVLPGGVEASISGHAITIRFQGKAVTRDLGKEKVEARIEGGKIILETEKDTKRENALLNSFEQHVLNLVKGLQKPFEYKLAIVYSHFPMTVSVKGNWVEINNFVGEKKPRKARILPDTHVEAKGKEIWVRSSNKEHAGQTAANLENATQVRGKDRRVYQDGIYIVTVSSG